MTNLNRRSLLGAGGFLAAASIGVVRFPKAALAADAGTLTLYNGQHAKTTKAVVEAFTKATGIKVDQRNGSSSQLANQIMEEGEGSPADVFYSEESPPVAALAEKGLLAKTDPQTLAAVPARYVSADGTWVGASARSRVVVFNKSMIEENDLPDSVLDFASDKWKGKVAFVPTSGAFQEQVIAISRLKGRDAALDWLKGLKEYGAIYNGNGAAMKAVEAGEIATALINNYYWFSLAAERGADKMHSALYYMGHKDPGALITVSAAGILKSTRNLEAAQKFMAFLVSEGGQAAIADSVAEYPLRPGVKSPFALKPFDELDPPDVTAADLGDAADAAALRREAGLS
jgi:iron(III) transport system substrate-binding protein